MISHQICVWQVFNPYLCEGDLNLPRAWQLTVVILVCGAKCQLTLSLSRSLTASPALRGKVHSPPYTGSGICSSNQLLLFVSDVITLSSVTDF